MSSGFMVGPHQARLAQVCAGVLAHVNHGHQSGFFFLIKFNILVGPTSNSSKSEKKTSQREKSLGMLRRNVCWEPCFEKPCGPGPEGVGRWTRLPRRGRSTAKPHDVTDPAGPERQTSGFPEAALSPHPAGPRARRIGRELGAGGWGAAQGADGGLCTPGSGPTPPPVS